MAGHYLATTNPEAAAAIGQERSGDLPDIGDLVVYYPRPGEMPGGINRFPMLVMHVNHDGMVYGIAIAGINDERDVRAFRRSTENPAPAWDWPHQERRQEPRQERDGGLSDANLLNTLDEMVNELAEDMRQFRNKLDEVIKELNKLEGNTARRLDRLEQELGLADQPKPQREASPPARAAHKPAAKSKRKSKR
jgi:hypothetical protein